MDYGLLKMAGDATRTGCSFFKTATQIKTTMETPLTKNINCLAMEDIGDFLDGIIFSPDEKKSLADHTAITAESAPELEPTSSIPMRLEPEDESHGNVSAQIDDGGTELISSSDFKPQDILCVRGNGGIHNPANITFRQVISSNKSQFDSLRTLQEKQTFSTNLWMNLRDSGHRFLRPVAGGLHEVLDCAKSVLKVRQALLSCRTSCDPCQPVNDESDLPIEEKIFDDVARASLRKMLARQEFVDAMQRNWGEDTMVKVQQFEEHMIERFRSAAVRGVSVDEYSNRLTQTLLKELDQSNE